MRRRTLAVLVLLALATPLAQATQGSGDLVASSPGSVFGPATMTADAPVLHHVAGEDGTLTLRGDLNITVRSTTYHENGSRETENRSTLHANATAVLVRGSSVSARLDGPVRAPVAPPDEYAPDGRPTLVVMPGPVEAVQTATTTTQPQPTMSQDERSGRLEVRRHDAGNLTIAPLVTTRHDGSIDLVLLQGAIRVDGSTYRTQVRQETRTVCDREVGDRCLVSHEEEVVIFNQTFVRAADADLEVAGVDLGDASTPGSNASSTQLSADRWQLEMNATIRFEQARGELTVGDEAFPVEDTFVEVGGELTLDLAEPERSYEEMTRDDGSLRQARIAPGYPVHVEGDVRHLRIGRSTQTFPPEAVAVGAAGLGVALAGALVYLWPALKFAATKLVVAPFYAHVEQDEVLDNATRNTIFEAIKQDPGLSATDLSKRADCGWGTVVYHLAVLEQNGLVISSRDGRHRRFFPYSGMDFRHKDVFSAIRNETTAAVLNAVREAPGIHQKALRKEIGIAASTVNWHISKLEDAGLVEKERDGRKVTYFPGPKVDLLSERDLDPT